MDTQKFGSFIADIRRKKGLTQKKLAEMLHVSDKTISKWECGQGYPNIELLEPLSEALEISLLELMKAEKLEEQHIELKEADSIMKDYISNENHKKHSFFGGLIFFILRLVFWGVCGYFFLTGITFTIYQIWGMQLQSPGIVMASVFIGGLGAIYMDSLE